MSNQPNQQLIKQQNNEVRELFNKDSVKQELAKVLPKHLTPERMTRVALTACMKSPGLFNCTKESLLQALMLCSQAGLEPDGRLAHLIPYGNMVQVIFDYKGLVALAIRNGMEAVYADKVCEADAFEAYVENGDKILRHRPDYRKSRGEPVVYYAVCKRNGVADFEVMSKEEIDGVRRRSKAADKGPWVTDYDEMAKKTVLRRMSKRWDLLPEIRDVINADDDTLSEIKAPLSKPIFEVQTSPPNESEKEERLPDDGAEEPAQTFSAPAPTGQPLPVNYVKAVRGLCKVANITEPDLLAFLVEIGSTDGSVATLEELAMYEGGSVLKLVHDQWAGEKGIAAKIKGAK